MIHPLKRLLKPPWLAAYYLWLAATHPGNRRGRLSAVGRTVLFLVRSVVGRPSRVPLGDRSQVVAVFAETNSRKACYSRYPDWPEMVVWRSYLNRGDLFVDVGANVGLYSVLAGELGAEVIAVEPASELVPRLREHLKMNDVRCEIVEFALSDRPGVVSFTSGLDSYNHLIVDDANGREIPATTVDDLIGDRFVAGMKVDVQGAESLVLRGATQALKEGRIGLVQLEWNDRSRRLLGEPRSVAANVLRDAGYELLRADRVGCLVPAGDDLAEGERDVFARRRLEP